MTAARSLTLLVLAGAVAAANTLLGTTPGLAPATLGWLLGAPLALGTGPPARATGRGGAAGARRRAARKSPGPPPETAALPSSSARSRRRGG
ncbi:MAG: hypothetical protein U0807_18705 [Candidatus Binatia bacterium]